MDIKAVIGFLIGLFGLGILGGIALTAVNLSRGRKARPGIILAVVGFIFVAILWPLSQGLVLVQPNEVGVVFRQTSRGDRALLDPLQSGLSWVLPFIDQVIIYDVGKQSITMAGSSEFGQVAAPSGQYSAVRAISNDGQVIFVDVTAIFRVDHTKINSVHRNWRSGYVDSLIVPQVRSEVRNAVSLYSAEQIYSGRRGELEVQIAAALAPKIELEGFLLTDILIRDISFSPEFTDAIEQKQIAEQEALRAAFRVRQAEQEAEQARVEAKGQADASVITAQGEAQAIVLKAQAESEALKLINEILAQNPNLIQWQYISELGDQVQIIIIPSNSPFLFDLEQLLLQAGAQPVTPTGALPTPTVEPPAGPGN